MNFSSEKKKGFTIVEILVVLTIITIMTGMTFANYKSGDQQFVLELEAYRLAQDFRRAQEYAMSAKEVSGLTIGGYGVYLEQGDTSYIIYADSNPSGGNGFYDAGDYIFETCALNKKAYLKTVSTDFLSANFVPPDPKTVLTGDGGETNEAVITLNLEGSGASDRSIRINKAGLIYVE